MRSSILYKKISVEDLSSDWAYKVEEHPGHFTIDESVMFVYIFLMYFLPQGF